VGLSNAVKNEAKKVQGARREVQQDQTKDFLSRSVKGAKFIFWKGKI